MGAITVSGEAKLGNYKLTILHPVSGAGAFRVDGPDGIEVGTGQVGTAFSAGGLAFTLADGTPDFVAGDGFDITVSGGTEKYAIMDPAATDGTGHAAGILYGDTDASAADTACTITARQAEVNSAELVWKSGITDPQKTAALAALAALGIIAR
jgi:hypothetical protein